MVPPLPQGSGSRRLAEFVRLRAAPRLLIAVLLPPPPGASAVVKPIIGALLEKDEAPTSRYGGAVPPAGAADGDTVTNGNLKVSLDPATGLVTATRVHDGKILLSQTALAFDTPANHSRKGSVAAFVTFAGLGAGEFVYGLGEHKNSRVEQGTGKGYTKTFADSLFYGKSQGGDVSIPWYARSRAPPPPRPPVVNPLIPVVPQRVSHR